MEFGKHRFPIIEYKRVRENWRIAYIRVDLQMVNAGASIGLRIRLYKYKVVYTRRKSVRLNASKRTL